MSTICEVCNSKMFDAQGCIETLVRFPDGKMYERLTDTLCGEHEEERNCHDCGCAPGHFHHPGCDNEMCPRCGGQLLSCDCNYMSTTEYIPLQRRQRKEVEEFRARRIEALMEE